MRLQGGACTHASSCMTFIGGCSHWVHAGVRSPTATSCTGCCAFMRMRLPLAPPRRPPPATAAAAGASATAGEAAARISGTCRRAPANGDGTSCGCGGLPGGVLFQGAVSGGCASPGVLFGSAAAWGAMNGGGGSSFREAVRGPVSSEAALDALGGSVPGPPVAGSPACSIASEGLEALHWAPPPLTSALAPPSAPGYQGQSPSPPHSDKHDGRLRRRGAEAWTLELQGLLPQHLFFHPLLEALLVAFFWNIS